MGARARVVMKYSPTIRAAIYGDHPAPHDIPTAAATRWWRARRRQAAAHAVVCSKKITPAPMKPIRDHSGLRSARRPSAYCP